MTHSISNAGLVLMKTYEGFRATPAQLPGGGWVVGFGHVRIADAGGRVTKTEAANLLALDVAPFERLVNDKVATPLTQGQFDALVSFAFSVGAEAFVASQVLRRVNAGDFLAAGYAIDAWRKSDVSGDLEVIATLVRRRAAEKAMLLKDVAGEGAPSVFLRAQLDHAASMLAAPISYAVAPAIEAAPAKHAKPDPAVRLVEILKSEPATEALLLTQVVVDDNPEFDGEITTAHAKPVARPLDAVREATRRAYAEQTAQDTKTNLPWMRTPFDPSPGAENFGLIALLLFGVGLIAIAAAMLFGGPIDMVDVASAGAVAAPGLAASLMAGFGLARAPAAASKI